ncbi:hypothetical protein V8C86DRAFT_2822580, partial [Haematococcus lacustris]
MLSVLWLCARPHRLRPLWVHRAWLGLPLKWLRLAMVSWVLSLCRPSLFPHHLPVPCANPSRPCGLLVEGSYQLR